MEVSWRLSQVEGRLTLSHKLSVLGAEGKGKEETRDTRDSEAGGN